MATVMANMMKYMNTMKIMELSQVKNKIFHYISSIALSKIKIDYENYEDYDNYIEIKKRIIQKDLWISDNYNSFIFDQARIDVTDRSGLRRPIMQSLNQYCGGIDFISIYNISIDYVEMRYFSRRIQCDLFGIKLENCNITDSKLNCLIGVQFSNLRSLSLANNPVTDDAIRIISKCNIRNLRSLDFSGTKVTPKTIDILLDLYNLFNNIMVIEMVFGDEWKFVFDTKIIRQLNIMIFICRKKHLVNFNEENDNYITFVSEEFSLGCLTGTNLDMYHIKIDR